MVLEYCGWVGEELKCLECIEFMQCVSVCVCVCVSGGVMCTVNLSFYSKQHVTGSFLYVGILYYILCMQSLTLT